MASSEPSNGGKEPQDARVASVGERLRAARSAQGLSLEQLAAELRIEARQLAALERNDFAQIGVPVFVKGYLKQYGTRLGLNPAELIAAYQNQDAAQDIAIQPSRTIKMRDERQIAFWVVAIVVLTVLAALLAYWWINEPVLAFSGRSEAAELSARAAGAAGEPSGAQLFEKPAGVLSWL